MSVAMLVTGRAKGTMVLAERKRWTCRRRVIQVGGVGSTVPHKGVSDGNWQGTKNERVKVGPPVGTKCCEEVTVFDFPPTHTHANTKKAIRMWSEWQREREKKREEGKEEEE